MRLQFHVGLVSALQCISVGGLLLLVDAFGLGAVRLMKAAKQKRATHVDTCLVGAAGTSP
jgi:hypothetical protein